MIYQQSLKKTYSNLFLVHNKLLKMIENDNGEKKVLNVDIKDF